MRRSVTAILIGLLIFFSHLQVSADTATYIYDDLGRLIRVIDSQGNVATYNYDEVGNLTSITTSTKDDLKPLITSIAPDFVRAGATVTLNLSGENLLGSALTTDNLGIAITETKVTDTSIIAIFSVSEDARQGPTLLTVINAIGSASIPITVYPPSPGINLTPPILVVQPSGGTGIMTVSLSNPDVYPTTVVFEIDNPVIASVDPTQATIPAGETFSSITITG